MWRDMGLVQVRTSWDSPSSDTMWTKHSTFFWRKEHFDGFSFSPASFILSNTTQKLSKCSLKLFPNQLRHQCDHCKPARTRSIRRWNVAEALQSPNGMTLNSNRPSGVQNAFFCQSFSLISTCRYPLVRSTVLNQWEPSSVWVYRRCREGGRHLYVW